MICIAFRTLDKVKFRRIKSQLVLKIYRVQNLPTYRFEQKTKQNKKGTYIKRLLLCFDRLVPRIQSAINLDLQFKSNVLFVVFWLDFILKLNLDEKAHLNCLLDQYLEQYLEQHLKQYLKQYLDQHLKQYLILQYLMKQYI